MNPVILSGADAVVFATIVAATGWEPKLRPIYREGGADTATLYIGAGVMKFDTEFPYRVPKEEMKRRNIVGVSMRHGFTRRVSVAKDDVWCYREFEWRRGFSEMHYGEWDYCVGDWESAHVILVDIPPQKIRRCREAHKEKNQEITIGLPYPGLRGD